MSRWRGDGKEIFFLALDGTMMAAGIDTAKSFRKTTPRSLFKTDLTDQTRNHPYVVNRVGTRFLYPVLEKQANPAIEIVVNWLAANQK